MEKTLRLFGSVITALVLFTSAAFCAPLQGQALTKKKVLADLDCIQSMFEVKYAPKAWKKEFAGWDLNLAIDEAKQKIESHPALTLKESQMILRDFFNSTKDYHVGVRFYSTESAGLPFLVKGAEGRYFISYVDRDQVTKREFPFEEGDEILSFGGVDVAKVIEEIRIRDYGSNTFETDQALAEYTLTHRRGELGQKVPSGKVEIRGIKKGTSQELRAQLTWQYHPEKIRDFSRLGTQIQVNRFGDEKPESELKSLLKKTHFFEKMMVASFWDKSLCARLDMNKHALGARKSFIPPLGRKLWKSPSDAIFDAYIFESPEGKKIGYIRLPHYIGDSEEVEEFGLFMNLFDQVTDALVIDQVNNPGGSAFYLYALAATLTDKPLYTPKHHIALTQEEVFVAHVILPYLEQIFTDEAAKMILGDNLGGYPIDMQFVKLLKRFCLFLMNQWQEGKLYSEPTFLFGIDEIHPHPQFRYSKPILLLINSLDFSGGDFFPAILQDNKRATIFGTRTAGAGGYVINTEYPNHSGIKNFVMTGSLAERIDKQPIENLGVQPDILYELTVADLQDNYSGYVSAILETVESIARRD